jgi:hypothetical protein
MNSVHRSILTRALMTGVASLAFMLASAGAVRAQTVIGTDGGPGANCDTDGCQAGTGGNGESVYSGENPAVAIGGAGGPGGISFTVNGSNGYGGNGGSATADAGGGPTSSATAIGGAGGVDSDDICCGGGAGGNATATSTAISNGFGNATSSATATNGLGNFSEPANATATSRATASGSGGATASAIATGSSSLAISFNATSFAETAEGGLAQAQAQAGTETGLAQSAAKTTFGGVSVQSKANTVFSGLTNAIAQGGSGQLPVDPEQGGSLTFSTALPNTVYATTLIGSASNVADALLGPDDKIFGTAILEGTENPDGIFANGVFGSSSTLDFSFRGDLILGVVTGGLSKS